MFDVALVLRQIPTEKAVTTNNQSLEAFIWQSSHVAKKKAKFSHDDLIEIPFVTDLNFTFSCVLPTPSNSVCNQTRAKFLSTPLH